MIKLELTQEELQYIMNCVAQRPLAECEQVVNKIRHQVNSQEKATELEVKK